MTITLQNAEGLTLAEMQELVEGSRAVGFDAQEQEAVYGFMQRVLVAQQYGRLSKGQKGIVRRFLTKLTGLSRAQTTRLIGQWVRRRRIQAQPARRRRFPHRYTPQDMALLVAVCNGSRFSLL